MLTLLACDVYRRESSATHIWSVVRTTDYLGHRSYILVWTVGIIRISSCSCSIAVQERSILKREQWTATFWIHPTPPTHVYTNCACVMHLVSLASWWVRWSVHRLILIGLCEWGCNVQSRILGAFITCQCCKVCGTNYWWELKRGIVFREVFAHCYLCIDTRCKLMNCYYFQDFSRLISYVHICNERTETRDMFLVNEHMLRKLSSTLMFVLSVP
jgi:hypothetical protein